MSHCGLHCLKVSDISVEIDKHVLLQNVNLHSHCGQLTAIIGKNGAGKSTLLRAILGEIPHKGEVEFSGHNGTPVKGQKPKIGYVPQAVALDRHSPATVGDVLLTLMSAYPVFFPKRREKTEKLKAHLAQFRADMLWEQPMGKLSGGELQRVLLAAATVGEPDLLILDEPVSGVDQKGLLEFYQLLEELKKRDMVILLVSHDLAFVRKHADRVLLLDKTVKAYGSPEEVFAAASFVEVFGEEGRL